MRTLPSMTRRLNSLRRPNKNKNNQKSRASKQVVKRDKPQTAIRGRGVSATMWDSGPGRAILSCGLFAKHTERSSINFSLKKPKIGNQNKPLVYLENNQRKDLLHLYKLPP